MQGWQCDSPEMHILTKNKHVPRQKQGIVTYWESTQLILGEISQEQFVFNQMNINLVGICNLSLVIWAMLISSS